MECTPEQAAEGQAIVKVLAAVLDRLVCSNANLARTDPGSVTKFHALKAPGIGIQAYLERIHKYASCSNECFIMALIYIDRLIQRNNFLLTELNVHRVVITAILLAAKFFDDAYYNNAYYSKVGGVLVSEMNGLEVDFLFRINFSLHVTPEVFEKYKAELVAHSVHSCVAMPQVPQAPPRIDETACLDPMAMDQPMTQSGPLTTSIPNHVASRPPLPPQVTPSPSHAASRSVAAPLAAPPVEPRIAEPNSHPHPLYVAEQLIATGIPQQLLQRANSLPPHPTHTGRCLDNNRNPPYSAPMASRLPSGTDDQYFLVSNHVYPLQTTLVHHHHGVQDQSGFGHPHNGYGLGRESFGSVAVAGHY